MFNTEKQINPIFIPYAAENRIFWDLPADDLAPCVARNQ